MDDLISRAEVMNRLEAFCKWCKDGRLQGAEFVLDCLIPNTPSVSADADDRLYIKIYADDEPSVKAEKLYQICGETQNREVAEWLKEYFPSAETEWIPVSERLPNEDARYLVQMSYGIMRVLSWANVLEKVDDFDFYNEKHGGWYELDSEWGYCERNEVIAWMPLPKPYREDREDYKLATEQMEHDAMYEPTYNSEDGSM